jgi:hypothetical protein
VITVDKVGRHARAKSSLATNLRSLESSSKQRFCRKYLCSAVYVGMIQYVGYSLTNCLLHSSPASKQVVVQCAGSASSNLENSLPTVCGHVLPVVVLSQYGSQCSVYDTTSRKP